MAAFVKTKLKSARDSLSKKDYAVARDAANDVLSFEPDNYNANVFLGLANLELRDLDASERAYKRAISTNPDQILAWQGLSKFYERTERWDDCVSSLHEQLRLLSKTDDATKCAETIQRIIDIRRRHGTALQLVDALKLTLHSSPYFSLISTLPDADASTPSTTLAIQRAVHHSLHTLKEIIGIIQREEELFMTREFEKRRTRLNAGSPGQVKREVGLELWSRSELPNLYEEVLGHPDSSDEERRAAESMLLLHRLKHLEALAYSPSTPLQDALRNSIMEMVSGIVLLDISNEIAWRTYMNTRDVLDTDDYDFQLLRRFCRLFPALPLSRLIGAFFKYRGIVTDDPEEGEQPTEVGVEDEDLLINTMTDAFEQEPTSVTSARLIADVYYRTHDYENSIKVAQMGIDCVKRIESELSLHLPLNRRAFDTVLATGLVHHFPPKHHSRALPIIDQILKSDRDDIPCLLGRAYVLQHGKQWDEASVLFDRVTKLTSEHEDDNISLEAEEEAAWCTANNGHPDVAAKRLEDILNRLREYQGYGTRTARACWRLGRCLWELDDKPAAYAQFIAALKYNNGFAPAFTSLGIYYLEAVSPPDTVRASKCFQKAFELDAREAEAAHRLAEGFAEEQEWDLVELVARRTIAGEGEDSNTVQAKKYLPLNSWAWKAVGVVELQRHNYTAAIQSLQVALRADETDASCWTRLGEAYLLAGRHPAALKAFLRAKELDKGDWTVDYFTATVHQELGEFEAAISLYKVALGTNRAETGISFALAQTYLLAAVSYNETGYLERAVESLACGLQLLLDLLHSDVTFKRPAWKMLADYLLAIPLGARWTDNIELRDAFTVILALLPNECGDLSNFLEIPTQSDVLDVGGVPLPLILAALVCRYRTILVSSDDTITGAAAWYDLGVSLQSIRLHLSAIDRKVACTSQVVACARKAVLADPSCDVYWSALGHAYFSSNAQIAQHALIRAIECNSTSAAHWTDLGLLYLQCEDPELANQALLRAQTADSDYTEAWGGQALIASENLHCDEARALLEHTVGLTRAVPELDLEFAIRAFKKMATTKEKPDSDRLLTVFGVLDRYRKRNVRNPTALHLFALTAERLGLYSVASDAVLECIACLEALYEHCEDRAVEHQFVVANTTLGRLRLALGEYTNAAESFTVAQSLLIDLQGHNQAALRAHIHFGNGLANLKLGDVESSLGHFEAALNNIEVDDQRLRGHCSLLLSQALWSLGSTESREAARDQLLESIAADPEDLSAILNLACIGMISADDDLVDATLSEVLSLPPHRRLDLDPQNDVVRIRTLMHLLNRKPMQAIVEAQKAVHARPNSVEASVNMARLLLQTRASPSAAAALSSRKLDVPSQQINVLAQMQSEAGATQSIRLVQRAIMRSPWDRDTWRVFALTST